MKIGLCAWSFTGSHRESGRELDPFEPEGLARLAALWGLASIEGSAGWFEGRDPGELAAFRDRLDADGLESLKREVADTLAEGPDADGLVIETTSHMMLAYA